MASVVDICNLALGHIGTKAFISSLTDDSAEAEVCNRFYASTRDAALASAPWPFAKKRADLALLNTTREGWAFCYARPSTCLSPRFIWNGLRNPRADQLIPFEQQLDDAGEALLICTNQPSAVLVYTARVENPGLYSPQFVSALSWLLASNIVAALNAKPEHARLAFQSWLAGKSEAHAAALNEQWEPLPESIFLAERS